MISYRYLTFALCAVYSAHAAAYAPAAVVTVPWTPNVSTGVGVPGGIPARSTIYTTITTTGDSTDRRSAIEAAVSACPTGQTVLLGAGTFYVSSLNFGQYDDVGNGRYAIGGKTLRGSGSSTILRLTGSSGISAVGGVFDGGQSGTVSGSPVKGDTTLTVSNTAGLSVGRVVKLITENDDTLPVLHVNGYLNVKTQTVWVTAVNTGAGTVTFQPALYQTPTKRDGGAALAMTWASQTASATLVDAGFEDFVIENTYGSATKLMRLSGAQGCWVKNVRLNGVLNYGLDVSEAVQCEVRGCWIGESRDENWYTANHGGLIMGDASACLIEDNILLKHLPLIESQNGPISGNVFAYNFGLQYGNTASFSNHGAGNHCNLWEGNCTTGITQDGYYGSADGDVIYRNDLHGIVLGSVTPHWPVSLYRFSRRWEVVGNQLGRSGTTLAVHMGGKTAFNSFTSGTANNYTGDPHIDLSLTGTATRIADNSYTVAMDTTTGQLNLIESNQWPIYMRWSTTSVRNWLSVTNIASLVVSLGDNGSNNSFGDVASTGTAVRLWPGANGFQEDDLAVAHTTTLLGNYYFKDGEIPAGQALGSTTLPDSLFRSSAPSFFSGYTWPPYSPTSPVTSYGQIPAGARYIASPGSLIVGTLTATRINSP